MKWALALLLLTGCDKSFWIKPNPIRNVTCYSNGQVIYKTSVLSVQNNGAYWQFQDAVTRRWVSTNAQCVIQ